ncbi:MAG: nitroreductase family protein [Methanosarcinaceae archaeon]|nr:nitroreductase family protein [Methanosarcinaceae archaeon]
MDLYEAIEKRKSIRKFKPDFVPDTIIHKILSVGTQAPNAFNREPWEFILVKDRKLRDEITGMRIKIPPQKVALETAPVLLVVCYNNELAEDALASAYACVENILLAATAEGLGGVPLTFHGKKIKALLKIPEGYDVATVIPLGYPDESPNKPTRIPLDQKLHINGFSLK